ncbi:hypothetical protein L5515_011780 [Caenorhabditis briggsae]|uniref:Uncharacterized protein n=2 Tax=Caenorhabditis briggsae TaxID=6238 RepID=A0AAE9EVT2_CAEBR|nr:hypothetical protein L5515_011780 [Caenorhabditis briggsae]
MKMNLILINSLFFVSFPFISSSAVEIISIENPLKNVRHCVQLQLEAGSSYRPYIDHLLEDGCKHPMRQNILERDFNEAVYNGERRIYERIRMVVNKGLIDWPTFKRKHLGIPNEFSENVNGYSFVDDINPLCSKDEMLFVRLCFSKNPTRRFGRPDILETSDGSLYQFQIDNRYLSSSDCAFIGNFGRCKSKMTSIIFQLQSNIVTSLPILSSSSWTIFGTIGIILISIFLLSISIWCFNKRRRDRRKGKENQKDPNLNSNCPESEYHKNIPFIDDAIVFDI